MVRRILNLEGAAVIGASVYFYFFRVDGNWVLFVGLLLAPDIGLLAFASGNNRIGSILYDAFHTYVLSVSLLVSGMAAGSEVVIQIGLILAAHIGMDRAGGLRPQVRRRTEADSFAKGLIRANRYSRRKATASETSGGVFIQCPA